MLPSLVWVAEHEGYFKQVGLDVEIQEYPSGKTALATMLETQKLDMVTAAQTPVMFNSFSRDDYAIMATMVHSDNDSKVLARKDHGIQSPADLRGKKIGVTKGSTGHFFLSRFLIQYGLF